MVLATSEDDSEHFVLLKVAKGRADCPSSEWSPPAWRSVIEMRDLAFGERPERLARRKGRWLRG